MNGLYGLSGLGKAKAKNKALVNMNLKQVKKTVARLQAKKDAGKINATQTARLSRAAAIVARRAGTPKPIPPAENDLRPAPPTNVPSGATGWQWSGSQWMPVYPDYVAGPAEQTPSAYTPTTGGGGGGGGPSGDVWGDPWGMATTPGSATGGQTIDPATGQPITSTSSLGTGAKVAIVAAIGFIAWKMLKGRRK